MPYGTLKYGTFKYGEFSVVTTIPYRDRMIYWQDFSYKGYSEDLIRYPIVSSTIVDTIIQCNTDTNVQIDWANFDGNITYDRGDMTGENIIIYSSSGYEKITAMDFNLPRLGTDANQLMGAKLNFTLGPGGIQNSSININMKSVIPPSSVEDTDEETLFGDIYDSATIGSISKNYTTIASGYGQNLAIKTDNSISAWGYNDDGECDVSEPNSDFIAVASGLLHSLGIKSDGSIVAWGWNVSNQCDVPEPNSDFVSVAAGTYHSLGLKSDGSIVTWGANTDNQCDVPTPNSDFVSIAAGTYHSLGLKSDGSIVTWGSNTYNQCDVPVPNSEFVSVASGLYHSLGLKYDGSIVAWGWNSDGQCTVPGPNSEFVSIAGGLLHSLGLKSDGSIVAWGSNDYGQCTVPTPNSDFVSISAGTYHSLGLKSDGSIVAWGSNDFDQRIVPDENFLTIGEVICNISNVSLLRSYLVEGGLCRIGSIMSDVGLATIMRPDSENYQITLTLNLNTYASFPDLFPDYWTPIGTVGGVSIKSEKYLEFYGTSPTEIIYTGTKAADIPIVDGYSNYGVSLIFQCMEGTKLSILFKHSGEIKKGKDRGIKLTFDHITDTISLTKYDNFIPYSTSLASASHVITSNNFYQLEIWNYGNLLFAWINEYLIFNGIGLSGDYDEYTHFGILNESQHTVNRTYTRLFNLQVFLTIAQPARALEEDPTDLLVRFRKDMQTQVGTVDHDNWNQFNYAFRHWLRHKDIGRIDKNWWNNGYPLRKPSTEEWIA